MSIALSADIGANIRSGAKWVFENALFGAAVAGSTALATMPFAAPWVIIAIGASIIALTIIEANKALQKSTKTLTAMTVMGGSFLAMFSSVCILVSGQTNAAAPHPNIFLGGAALSFIAGCSLYSYGAYYTWKHLHPPKKSRSQW